jgi:hypothetical protein
MIEHLRKEHGWTLTQNEIPEAFQHSYEWRQKGWVCVSCGQGIGNWHDNRDNVETHFKICTAKLQASFKRMSVEELGRKGAREDGDLENEWPLHDDQDYQSNWL